VAIVNKKKKKVSEEIPSSAMADIAFLLLIFFLVTTGFPKDQGLAVVLPEESEQVEVSQKNVMHISIYPDGTVQVRRGESDAIEPMPASRIEQTWRADAAQNPNLIASVNTHPQAQHRHMIAVLDALHLAGANRISLQVLEE
jgi:biopolymer transport protein ExbD